MALRVLDVGLGTFDVDPRSAAFVEDAAARAAEIRGRAVGDSGRIVAFVDSNLLVAQAALALIVRRGLAPGRRFCEWGSGVGGVTCIAAMLGFSARGVEIEPELVTVARRLAAGHGIAAQFHMGNYRPRAIDIETVERSVWVSAASGDWADFDVVYAYPWPAEERFIDTLFQRFAPDGAILVTYHGGTDVRIRQLDAESTGARYSGEAGTTERGRIS